MTKGPLGGASIVAGAIAALGLLTVGCSEERAGGRARTDNPGDLILAAVVRDRIQEDLDAAASRIRVTSRAGVVTLAGVVPSEEERAQSEAAAEDVDGVHQVVNALRVGEPGVASPPPGMSPQEATPGPRGAAEGSR